MSVEYNTRKDVYAIKVGNTIETSYSLEAIKKLAKRHAAQKSTGHIMKNGVIVGWIGEDLTKRKGWGWHIGREEMTAFELCGVYRDEQFRLKKGKVIWEAISYQDNIDKCKLTRIVEAGGKPFLLGLRFKTMYVHPETKVVIIKE